MKINKSALLSVSTMLILMPCCLDFINPEVETTTTTTIPSINGVTTSIEGTTPLPTTISLPLMGKCQGQETENCFIFSNSESCITHYSCPNETCYQCAWYDDWCDTGKECIKEISIETTSTTVPVTTTMAKGVACYENSDCGEIHTYFYCNYEIALEEQQPHTIGTAVYKVTKVPLCENPGTKMAKCITSHREILWESCSGWGECVRYDSTSAGCRSCFDMGKVWNSELKKCT